MPSYTRTTRSAAVRSGSQFSPTASKSTVRGCSSRGLTIDLWRGVSKLRNPVVFHELEFMEEWGSGIRRMLTECQDADLATPILEEIGTHFPITLSSLPVAAPVLSELDSKIVGWLAQGRWCIHGPSCQSVRNLPAKCEAPPGGFVSARGCCGDWQQRYRPAAPLRGCRSVGFVALQ